MKRLLTDRLVVAVLWSTVVIWGLGACAGAKIDPATGYATMNTIVGKQALTTNNQYVQLCGRTPPAIERADCDAWSKWYRQFKLTYAEAHKAYKDAVARGDITTARDAAERIQALSNQLVLFAVYGRH